MCKPPNLPLNVNILDMMPSIRPLEGRVEDSGNKEEIWQELRCFSILVGMTFEREVEQASFGTYVQRIMPTHVNSPCVLAAFRRCSLFICPDLPNLSTDPVNINPNYTFAPFHQLFNSSQTIVLCRTLQERNQLILEIMRNNPILSDAGNEAILKYLDENKGRFTTVGDPRLLEELSDLFQNPALRGKSRSTLTADQLRDKVRSIARYNRQMSVSTLLKYGPGTSHKKSGRNRNNGSKPIALSSSDGTNEAESQSAEVIIQESSSH